MFETYEDAPATGDPLTRGERVALAERWWDELLEVETAATLMADCGSTDIFRIRHAAARLRLLERHLGRLAFERCERLAHDRWRHHLGEEYSTAFLEGRALVRDEMESASSDGETGAG